MAPNMPMQLRYTPNDDRGLASTAFWKTKWEVGQAAAFGFGERPDYKKDDSVAPNNYGDISKQVAKTKPSVSRGVSIHQKYPSMEERYRDLSWPKSGPGPGKYDTRVPPGQGSWFNPVPNPSFSMQSRPILDQELKAGMERPGAGEYDVQTKVGSNSRIRKGTLYDIKIRGRYPYNDEPGAISPGPARYNVKEGFDAKGLLEKINNVPIPPSMPDNMDGQAHVRRRQRTSMPMPQPDGEVAEEDAEDYEGRLSGDRSRQGTLSKQKGKQSRTLARVESSPAELGR